MCKRGGCVPPPVVSLFKKFKKAGICFVLMPEKQAICLALRPEKRAICLALMPGKRAICLALRPEKREPVLFPCKKQKICSRYLI